MISIPIVIFDATFETDCDGSQDGKLKPLLISAGLIIYFDFSQTKFYTELMKEKRFVKTPMPLVNLLMREGFHHAEDFALITEKNMKKMFRRMSYGQIKEFITDLDADSDMSRHMLQRKTKKRAFSLPEAYLNYFYAIREYASRQEEAQAQQPLTVANSSGEEIVNCVRALNVGEGSTWMVQAARFEFKKEIKKEPRF